jgi:hypothetical protein
VRLSGAPDLRDERTIAKSSPADPDGSHDRLAAASGEFCPDAAEVLSQFSGLSSILGAVEDAERRRFVNTWAAFSGSLRTARHSSLAENMRN